MKKLTSIQWLAMKSAIRGEILRTPMSTKYATTLREIERILDTAKEIKYT